MTYSKFSDLNLDSHMDEDTFWRIVDSINWKEIKNLKKAYIIGKKTVMKALSYEEATTFGDTVSKLSSSVYDLIASMDDLPGDDGTSDLIAHIIGLGKETFYASINDVNLISARIEANDYVESFAYCVPYEDDYEKSDPEKPCLKEWSGRIYEELADFIRDFVDLKCDIDPLKVPNILKAKLRLMTETMCLYSAGHISDKYMLGHKDEIVNAYEDVRIKLLDHMCFLHAVRKLNGLPPASVPNIITNKWSVLNFFTDLEEYR